MYVCDVCDKKFDYNSQLKQHKKNKKCSQGIKKENNIVEYKCDNCNTFFKYKRSLERHTNKNSCSKIKFNSSVQRTVNKETKQNASTSESLVNINGDHNTNNITNQNTTNNITNNNNNKNVTINIIRPLGCEDVTFLDNEDMQEILTAEDAELTLLRKISENDENINCFKYNIKDEYISYVKNKKRRDMILEIVPVAEKSYEEFFYLIAYRLLNVIFYLCKDTISLALCDDIALNIYRNKFSSRIVPNEIENDLKAIINSALRKNAKNKIQKFITTHKADSSVNKKLSDEMANTYNLYNEVQKDLERVFKDGVKKRDFKFLKKNKQTVENNDSEVDNEGDSDSEELIASMNSLSFEQKVLEELERLEFRELHNTLHNFKEHAKRIINKEVDITALDEAKKRYKAKKEKEAEEQKAALIAGMKKMKSQYIAERDVDFNDESEDETDNVEESNIEDIDDSDGDFGILNIIKA